MEHVGLDTFDIQVSPERESTATGAQSYPQQSELNSVSTWSPSISTESLEPSCQYQSWSEDFVFPCADLSCTQRPPSSILGMTDTGNQQILSQHQVECINKSLVFHDGIYRSPVSLSIPPSNDGEDTSYTPTRDGVGKKRNKGNKLSHHLPYQLDTSRSWADVEGDERYLFGLLPVVSLTHTSRFLQGRFIKRTVSCGSHDAYWQCGPQEPSSIKQEKESKTLISNIGGCRRSHASEKEATQVVYRDMFRNLVR